MKTTFNLLTYVASLLGLGGAADKVDLNEILHQARERLGKIVRYHNIELPENYGRELRAKFLEASSDSKIDEAVAMRLIKNAENELVFGETQIAKNLPDVLKELGHIYYLNSVSQRDGWSCGYWSTFNAEAVDYLVTNGLNLTSENIQNHAIIHWTRVKNKVHLEAMEINSVARNIPSDGQKLNQHQIEFLFNNIRRAPENKAHILLKDVGGDDVEDAGIGSDIWPACCSINGPHIQRLVMQLTANDKTGRNTNNFDPVVFSFGLRKKRNKFFNNLKLHFLNQYVMPNRSGALHFICNLNGGYHWILISVVKLHNLRKPILVILDSAHFSLRGDFLDYVLFLHQQFIQPYIDAD